MVSPTSWIDGTRVTRFRLSNVRNWAIEFQAETIEEFDREFRAALIGCDCMVSLQAQHSGHWMAVGDVEFGVFYARPGTLRRCQAGRFETRGNGHRFLSVSPECPCSDVVWSMICRQPLPRHLESVECRACERLTAEDHAVGLPITHQNMQEAFNRVLQATPNYVPAEPNSGYICERLRQAINDYRAMAEQFVAQGRTRGTLVGSIANLMQAVARRMNVPVDEMLAWMATHAD